MGRLWSTVVVLTLCSVIENCSSVGNFTDCKNDLRILEEALYQPENIKQLNMVFYPSRKPPSRFIKVTYEFGDIDKCNVTYFWAVGGFLLIQPPQIFQLTSLYFSIPANELTDLFIKLPPDCLPLAGGITCTCLNEDHNLLDILTQQVWNYAVAVFHCAVGACGIYFAGPGYVAIGQ